MTGNKNNKRIEDIPKSVQEDLSFHFIDHIDEVLKFALSKLICKNYQTSDSATASTA